MIASRFRFSLRTMLLFFLLMGATLAVVRWNKSWITSVCITAYLVLQWTAFVAAFCQDGRAQAFWLGVAVFSFGYGLAAFSDTERSIFSRNPLYNFNSG